MPLIKVYQFQSEHRPAITSGSQIILDDMPSCDDCGLVFDNIHDVQRHIKKMVSSLTEKTAGIK